MNNNINKFTCNELRKNLDDFNLSPLEFAELIEAHPRTVIRWIKGLNEVPCTIALLFKAWKSLKDNKLEWYPEEKAVINIGDKKLKITKHKLKKINKLLENN